tara:strand:+ start:42 stop:722 length:681 start_codon:yes stop_codon:yes gene_type:complete
MSKKLVFKIDNSDIELDIDNENYNILYNLISNNNDNITLEFNSNTHIDSFRLSKDSILNNNNIINNIDPLLTKKDKLDIKLDMGSFCTIVYNDNSKKKVNVITKRVSINENSNEVIEIENTKEMIESRQGNNNTERQEKILRFLRNNSELENHDTKFLQLLRKLNVEDFNGLNSLIITEKRLPILAKQNYLKTIKTFISLLIKKKNEGEIMYNNIKIEDIVTNIML